MKTKSAEGQQSLKWVGDGTFLSDNWTAKGQLSLGTSLLPLQNFSLVHPDPVSAKNSRTNDI